MRTKQHIGCIYSTFDTFDGLFEVITNNGIWDYFLKPYYAKSTQITNINQLLAKRTPLRNCIYYHKENKLKTNY